MTPCTQHDLLCISNLNTICLCSSQVATLYMYIQDRLTSNEEQASVSDNCVVYTEVTQGYQCCSVRGDTVEEMVGEHQQKSTMYRETMLGTQV